MTWKVTVGTGIAIAGALAISSAWGIGCGGGEATNESVGEVSSPLTSTFQHGVGGYTSTDDLSISNQNGGNGATDRVSNQMIAWKKTGTDPYEAKAIVRFNNLTVPAGSVVTSAQLTLTVENWWTGFTLRGFYLKNTWNAAPAAPLGWLNRDTSVLWNTAGANGVGTDVTTHAPFTNSTWAGNGIEVKTFALDTSVVQGWVDNAATNQGIVLVNNTTNDIYLRIYSSEDTTVSRHPILSITYNAGGGGSCQTAASGQWLNTAFASQTGSFTANYDAIPNAANVDALVGFSNGAQSAFTGLATALRFNTSGFIDARNGGTYAAVTSIPYSAGVSYHFRTVVNVVNHTYSAFVSVGGGAEQTVATNYAFRTEQAAVTSLNNWTAHPESAGSSLQICGFAISAGGGGGDTTAPTISMTAPANGATVSGSIAVSANASDNVGVSGVQFLADGNPIGAEDTVTPYSFSYDTTLLSNGSHSFSARARDAAGNTTTATAVTATVNNAGAPTGTHPRIWLDATTLASLRLKAQQGSAQWTALRNVCNGFNGGTVSGAGTYCSSPNICAGYQGEDYVDPAMSVGLCYQIGLGIGDANTATWAAKGSAILTSMAGFTAYSTDSGYGIRNYGVTMALLYDWFHPALSAGLKSTVYASLNAWTTWYDANGFVRDHPHANYFAGYYAAKAYAALATEGDNASAPAMWSDFLNRMQKGGAGSLGTHTGVANYHTSYLNGGGWTEGWQYGAQSVRSMSLPSLAAKTAKNLDLINDAAAPYRYPLDSAKHLIHFTRPTRDYLDDRDTIRGGPTTCLGNARPSAYTLAVVTSMLSKWGDSLGPQFHKYARDVRTAVGTAQPWAEFLFWDDAAAEQPYTTLPKSFLATGYAAMRSDWNTTATWASMRAIAYVNAGNSGEQYPDTGALAIVRGSTALLVNAGFLHSCYGSTSNSWDDATYNEIYGGPKRIFNTFYNGTSGQIFRAVDSAPLPATGITRFEDRNGYVLTRAQDLEDVYPTASDITSWARDVVFFRPGLFVVYDRTTVGSTSGDQHMNWHFPPVPTVATPPSSGAKRYDVTDAVGGFKGALTTLLPANAATSVVNVFSSNKLYRVEVRPQAATTDTRWLTVLDTAAATGSVALGSVPVSSANVKGTVLTAAGGNRVAMFGAGVVGVNITGAVTFTEPAAVTKVVVADLAPSTSYAVVAAVSGGSHNVTIQPGAGFTTSSYGTLYVDIAANGAVTAGN